MKKIWTIALFFSFQIIIAQSQVKLYQIIDSISSQKIEKSIQTLVDFGTRNTFSDTISNTHGIGAARRWIKSEFEKIDSFILAGWSLGVVDVLYYVDKFGTDKLNGLPKV